MDMSEKEISRILLEELDEIEKTVEIFKTKPENAPFYIKVIATVHEGLVKRSEGRMPPSPFLIPFFGFLKVKLPRNPYDMFNPSVFTSVSSNEEVKISEETKKEILDLHEKLHSWWLFLDNCLGTCYNRNLVSLSQNFASADDHGCYEKVQQFLAIVPSLHERAMKLYNTLGLLKSFVFSAHMYMRYV